MTTIDEEERRIAEASFPYSDIHHEMKRPEELSADYLWFLLGAYATKVGDEEGCLFTEHKWVWMAHEQYLEKRNKETNFLKMKKEEDVMTEEEYNEIIKTLPRSRKFIEEAKETLEKLDKYLNSNH